MKVRVYYNAGLNKYVAQYESLESRWNCFEHFDREIKTITVASFKTENEAIEFLNDLKQKSIQRKELEKLNKVVFEDTIPD